MKRHIPNTLTSLNLFSGCIACLEAIQGSLIWVVFWVMLSGVFDFLDGFSSRILHSYSQIGKELDSLADMVSFGLAPALAVFTLIRKNLELSFGTDSLLYFYLPYFSFLIVIFSAIRLAKFNVDTRQNNVFIGLNTPSNAMFWVSYCAGIAQIEVSSMVLLPATLLLIMLFSYLLIAELPMFSLKKRRLRWKDNEFLIILLLGACVMISFWGVLGIAGAVLLYIILCLFSFLLKRRKGV